MLNLFLFYFSLYVIDISCNLLAFLVVEFEPFNDDKAIFVPLFVIKIVTSSPNNILFLLSKLAISFLRDEIEQLEQVLRFKSNGTIFMVDELDFRKASHFELLS